MLIKYTWTSARRSTHFLTIKHTSAIIFHKYMFFFSHHRAWSEFSDVFSKMWLVLSTDERSGRRCASKSGCCGLLKTNQPRLHQSLTHCLFSKGNMPCNKQASCRPFAWKCRLMYVLQGIFKSYPSSCFLFG